MNARDVSLALGARIDSLATSLFPAGHREGHYWCIGDLTGAPGKSLKIQISGHKAGRWADYAQSGVGGDALDLIAHAKYTGDLGQALSWARNWLGMPKDEFLSRQAPNAGRDHPSHVSSSSSVSETLDAARRIWTEAQNALGSPAETYLKSRGLVFPRRAPLRFHPACPRGVDRLPAMLGLMTDPQRNVPCGVHRTFLKPDGTGKAQVDPAKMIIGNAGVIRLTPDEDITCGLGLAEGIENTLTVMQHSDWSNMWAAGTASGIAKFPVLTGIETLTIFGDHDIAGTRAADECARRWGLAGREVRIIVPRQHADWNDALKAMM